MSRRICFGILLIGLTLPINVLASSEEGKSVEKSLEFIRANVKKVLDANPERQAAKVAVESAQIQIRGSDQPIYNPELEVEFESAEEDSYSLGLSQTLDWHDKRSTQQAALQVTLQQAKADYSRLTLTLANDVLSALTNYYTALEVTQLHKQRVKLLEQIVRLAENRLSAGDIDKSEVLLARLSLADAVIEHANQGVNVIDAQKTFFALSQHTIEKKSRFLVPLPDNVGENDNDEKIASRHPLVKIALLEIEQARRQVAVSQRERRADPQLGLSVGKDGDESLVGVQFSVPLQVRNNFSYTVDVAQNALLQAELNAKTTHRKIVADIRAAKAHFKLTANAWRIWSVTGKNQLTEHIQLLEQLWKNGELSTTDYLVQLEQNLHTQIAGVELKGTVWQSWFQWLNATGQVLRWLSLEKEYIVEGEDQ